MCNEEKEEEVLVTVTSYVTLSQPCRLYEGKRGGISNSNFMCNEEKQEERVLVTVTSYATLSQPCRLFDGQRGGVEAATAAAVLGVAVVAAAARW